MLKSKQEVVDRILALVERDKITMIDAIVHVSESSNIEIEVLANYVKQSPTLKERIRKEGVALRMVRE